MSRIRFVVEHDFDVSSEQLWQELIDWEGHGDWVPMTKVTVEAGDPHVVGAEFTARTGLGRLALVDLMRVSELRWNPGTAEGYCQVVKLGPILGGSASFEVWPAGVGSRAEWVEDLEIRYVPAVLAPLAAWAGRIGFKLTLRRLAAHL